MTPKREFHIRDLEAHFNQENCGYFCKTLIEQITHNEVDIHLNVEKIEGTFLWLFIHYLIKYPSKTHKDLNILVRAIHENDGDFVNASKGVYRKFVEMCFYNLKNETKTFLEIYSDVLNKYSEFENKQEQDYLDLCDITKHGYDIFKRNEEWKNIYILDIEPEFLIVSFEK